MSTGYLICKECRRYYELQTEESPDDFDRCQCGGKLEYSRYIDENQISKPLKNNLDRIVKYIFLIVLSVVVIIISLGVALFYIPAITGFFYLAMTVCGSAITLIILKAYHQMKVKNYSTNYGKDNLKPEYNFWISPSPIGLDKHIQDRFSPRQIRSFFLLRSLIIIIFGCLIVITYIFPNIFIFLNHLSSYIFFITFCMIALLIVLLVFYYLRYMKKII